MTIWKFALEITGAQTIDIPDGGEIIHVGNQRGSLCLWVAVNPDAPFAKRTFAVVGTGHTFDPLGLTYVGTAVVDPFVWHVYESCL